MSKRSRTPSTDAFYGGFSAALAVALYGEDGTSVRYVEAMETINVSEFLAWAVRNDDIELPRIRVAVRFIREQKRMRRSRGAI